MPTEVVARTSVNRGIAIGVGWEIDDAYPGESTEIVASVHQGNAHVDWALVVIKSAVDIVLRRAGERKRMPGYWLIDGTFDPRVVCLQAKAIQCLQKTSQRLIESEFGAVVLSVRDVFRGRQIELLRALAGNRSIINRDRGDEVRH